MTTVLAVDAVSDRTVDWHSINWKKAHREVRRLQARIAKAIKEGKARKAKSLQWILTHSFYGKVLAVKRVTENQGRKTAGVDKTTWSTPQEKTSAVQSLKRRGYKPMPLKRVYIPKANGKKRPLGIPTMKDRAMQALHLLALEPIAETTADPNSYGFRPMRASRDAVEQCYKVLRQGNSAPWILDADIAGCFDHINHNWLLENIPTDRKILKMWLEAGYMEKGMLNRTREGTPQGGIISPTLANMTLDGLEGKIRKEFPRKGNGCPDKVNLIRYADDFVITRASEEVLGKAKAIVESFIKERGLTLSPKKTHLRPIEEGFDFLGWNVRKYKGKLLIKPEKNNVKAFLNKIRGIIKKSKNNQARKFDWPAKSGD